jgi:DNA-directed RNA polymerase specialized sigma24 family protein
MAADEEALVVLRTLSVTPEFDLPNQIQIQGDHEMIYRYEKACQEAGMEESRIAEIRRFFDGEQKKLNRDKEAREKAGIVFNSLNALVDSEGMSEYEIPDERSNPEEMVVQNLAMDRLRQCLDELPAEDREFLFALFEGKYGFETALAKKMGIPRTTLQRRKDRLVEALRQKFFEKF